MLDLILGPLQETFFQKALIGGGLVAIVCGVVGCLVVLRRMAFLGDALSHAMIAGVAGGYLFMKVLFGIEAHAPAMLIGSLFAAVITVALIGFVSRVSRVKEDTAIGIMYTGVFAAGVVGISIFRSYIHIDLMHFIMGDVLAVADADLWASAITAAIVLSIVLLFFRHLQLTSFDPVMAASIGMPVVLLDYLLTSCVSLVVVSAVSMVGVILVVGLLITPAATAYLLSDRLDRMMMLSALFGLTSVIGGLYLCVWLDSAGGGAIMLFCTAQFLVVLAAAPRYGLLARWMRLRRMVPQQTVEDILGAALRADGRPLSGADLHSRLAAEAEARPDHRAPTRAQLDRAVSNLTAQGLLITGTDGILLSDEGNREAVRIRRAHRLWETYLQHVGTPAEEIHPRADALEHVRADNAVDYLDDLLDHPTTDPHGEEIPEDLDRTGPGHTAPLSLLREGRVCTVLGLEGDNPDLAPGTRLTVLPREGDGSIWVARSEDGILRFTHAEADGVMVECE